MAPVLNVTRRTPTCAQRFILLSVYRRFDSSERREEKAAEEERQREEERRAAEERRQRIRCATSTGHPCAHECARYASVPSAIISLSRTRTHACRAQSVKVTMPLSGTVTVSAAPRGTLVDPTGILSDQATIQATVSAGSLSGGTTEQTFLFR